MRCHTKVATTVVVALILGVTGCGAPEPSCGREATVVPAAVPALNPPALSPDPPALPHEFVAPAAPTGFEMSGPAFDVKANICQMNYVRPLNPPGDQKHAVCWVRKGFGVAPGSDSGGTSYILGHAWARTPLIFNPLSELAMQEVTGQNPDHFVPYSGAKPVAMGHNGKRNRCEKGRADTLITNARGLAVCFTTRDPSHLAKTMQPALDQLGQIIPDEKIMLGFDRGGAYSEAFTACRQRDIDFITYRRGKLTDHTTPHHHAPTPSHGAVTASPCT